MAPPKSSSRFCTSAVRLLLLCLAICSAADVSGRRHRGPFRSGLTPGFQWTECTTMEERVARPLSRSPHIRIRENAIRAIEEGNSFVADDLPPVPPLSALRCEQSNVTVPLAWSSDDGDAADPRLAGLSIQLSVQRWYAVGTQPDQRVLFLVEGGPGDDESSFIPLLPQLSVLQGNQTTFYLVDHRGTGRSTPLSCGESVGTWADCAAYLVQSAPAGLGSAYAQQFSTDNAARDLSSVISLVQSATAPAPEVYLYGMSYGSYLVNRFLVRFPSQVTAAILDGICPPDACDLRRFDEGQNAMGLQVLAACEAHDTCSSRFPSGLLDALGQFRFELEFGFVNTECTRVLNLTSRRLSFLFSVLASEAQSQPLVPALLYRLMRCDEAEHGDRSVASSVLAALGGSFQPLDAQLGPNPFVGGGHTNDALFAVIGVSELSQPNLRPAPLESALAVMNASSVAAGTSVWLGRAWKPFWDANVTYPPPREWGQYPPEEGSANLLLLNGDRDLQTALPLALHYDAAASQSNRRFLRVPFSSHVTLYSSPVRSAPLSYTCGAILLSSYVVAHGNLSAIDTSCLDDTIGDDFDAQFATTQQYAQVYFNTTNLWD